MECREREREREGERERERERLSSRKLCSPLLLHLISVAMGPHFCHILSVEPIIKAYPGLRVRENRLYLSKGEWQGFGKASTTGKILRTIFEKCSLL